MYDEIITPYIQTKGRVLSGCSTNACLAAKKLGLSKVALIGCIGRDYEKRYTNEALIAAAISSQTKTPSKRVQVKEEMPSPWLTVGKWSIGGD